MREISKIIMFMIILCSVVYSQQNIKIAAGPALFGTGDIAGTMAYLEHEHFVKKYFAVAPRLSFAYGLHKEPYYYLIREWKHQIIAFDYDMKLYLLKTKHFLTRISFAPSIRYLDQISPGMSYASFDDYGNRIAGSEKHHIKGINFGATIGFNAGMSFKHFSLGLQAASSMYHKGTGVLFLGPTLEFRY